MNDSCVTRISNVNSRIKKSGGRIIISPKIQSTYFNRSTFSGLRQQAFFNGLWNPYTVYLTGGGLRLRHFVPLFFVLSIAGLSFGGLLWQPLWWLLAMELILYLAIGSFMAINAAKYSDAHEQHGIQANSGLHSGKDGMSAQVRHAVESAKSAKANKEKTVNPLLVLIAFIQLHLAYGVGSLWGVISAPFKFGINRTVSHAGALPDRID